MNTVRLLVALEDRSERQRIVAALRAVNLRPVADTGDGQAAYELSRCLTPDLMILDAHLRVPRGGRMAETVLSSTDISLILLSDPEGLSLLHRLAQGGAAACLLRPVCPEQVALAALVAARHRREVQALRKRMETAERRLTDRRLVDRAKAVLMEELRINEAEAYHRLRRLSMNSRLPLGQVAEMVLMGRVLRG